MADVIYRANLKAAGFPLLSELHGRSIIVRQQDQSYVSGLAAKESLDSSVGVPQIYYCHNVVPTDSGYKSVGYNTHVPQAYPSNAGFGQVHKIRDDAGNSAHITLSAVGNVYVLEEGSTTWLAPTTPPTPATVVGKRITTAYVSGVTYIYFENVGCYTYNWGTNALSAVTLTGLTAADILGVIGNQGYLLAYSVDTLAWSSTIDPTDFTPSLETGAGGGSVEGLHGNIVTVEEVYGGLIVFAEENAVAAVFSGNARYPYNFTPITGCGGLQDADFTAADTGTGSLYAYTTSGMQLITLRSANTIFPEITDFISGSLLEDFDEVTLSFTSSDVGGALLQKRVSLIADRYLIISYGETELTHALYFDLSYKQWGRLKVTHTDCFEFTAYTAGSVELAKRSVAFLTSGGGVKILDSDIISSSSSGVMLLGKFQYVRTRVMQLQGVEFENVNQGDTFDMYDLPSYDGKNFQDAITGYLAASSGKFRKYLFHNTALNHTLVCLGAFNAVSAVLTFNVGGGR